MSQHLKRKAMEKSWPLPRKGTKYVTRPYPGKSFETALPLVIALRDVLKMVDTKKELKSLLNKNEIYVNERIIKEEKFPVGLFDVLSLPKIKKYFRATLTDKGKIALEEINEKDSQSKVCKVVGKKMLKKGILQINCLDGRNFLYKGNIAANDSIIFNLKENKVEKIIPLKAGAEVFVLGGGHIGAIGKISEINEKIKVQIKNNTFEIQAKNICVIK